MGRFEFFRKFAEIFAAQGAPPVSYTGGAPDVRISPQIFGKNRSAPNFQGLSTKWTERQAHFLIVLLSGLRVPCPPACLQGCSPLFFLMGRGGRDRARWRGGPGCGVADPDPPTGTWDPVPSGFGIRDPEQILSGFWIVCLGS